MLAKLDHYYREEGAAGLVRRLSRRAGRAARPIRDAVWWRVAYDWNPGREVGHPPRNRPGTTREAYAPILAEAKRRGIEIQPLSVDWNGYVDYMERARYPADYYREWLLEKSLEQYLSLEFIRQLGPEDVLIDIASQFSPFPEIVTRLYGARTFAQDLDYEPGVHGNRIGGSAAEIPVPDDFASAMTLHCSFEHLEADADTEFVRESRRVLRPGGRVCILPLYLNDAYCTLINPFNGEGRPSLDAEANPRYVRGWLGGRHGRFYDIAHLQSRVLDAWAPWPYRLYFLDNIEDRIDAVYLRFILVLEKPSDGVA